MVWQIWHKVDLNVMARDTRMPRSGNHRCLYYDGKYIKNMKLEADTVSNGVFYASITDSFVEKQETNGMPAHMTKKGKIETNDYVPDLTVNSFVLFRGELYVVDEIYGKEKDIPNMVGNRKPRTTYITLRR